MRKSAFWWRSALSKMWNLYVTPLCTFCLMNQIDLNGVILQPTKTCLQDSRCTSAKSLLKCGRSAGKAGIRHGWSCFLYCPGTIKPTHWCLIPSKPTSPSLSVCLFFPALFKMRKAVSFQACDTSVNIKKTASVHIWTLLECKLTLEMSNFTV